MIWYDDDDDDDRDELLKYNNSSCLTASIHYQAIPGG